MSLEQQLDNMSRLTCKEEEGDKFYEISADGKSGSAGVSSVKRFANPAEANKFMTKTIAAK